jgi:amino acid adenylation domain-containing protein
VAAALPDAPALASPGRELGFAEADERSRAVATALRSRLGPADGPVALLLDQSVDGLLGLLGVLGAGRPVVPLDPLVPAARLERIVRRAGASACLTSAEHAAVAETLAPDVHLLADLLDGPLLDGPVDAPLAGGGAEEPRRRGDDVAALVFTSGSTGEPKGVVWTNATMLNEAYAGRERLGFGPGDRTALVLPHSFAAGLTVVVFALLNGAGVYAYDPRALGVRDLPAWLTGQRLTTLHLTPSLLRSLLGALEPDQALPDLRLVSTGGEPVYGTDVAALRPRLAPGAAFVNWSGASEIGSLAFFELPAGAPAPEGALPAGRPAAGKDVAIVAPDGAPVAAGATGEVTVASAYLSAGYRRPTAETAARFTPLPDGRTAYRTGDLGRIDDNGDLVLLGRRDAAVKIRGYLVEPGEVEAALLAVDDVAEAVVTAVRNPPAPNRLVAYVVPKATGTTLSPARIRRRLRTALPSWMVPTTIVGLAELPRNERGKVDRAALPPPPAGPAPSATPRSQWEIVVADLWMRVLDLDEIGVEDDFMELGGDSLAAEELLSAVSERVGVTLPSSTLVDAPTLGEFAERVAHGPRSGPAHPTVVTLQPGGTRPPLFCFAGAGGLGLGFLSLSRQLGPDQPVYAFQAHGLEQRGIPDWTVERAARRHIQLVRVLRPRGPYLLAGHSLGGLIAMEAAHQLAAAGEDVGLLVLLDTYLPTTSKNGAVATAVGAGNGNGAAPAAAAQQQPTPPTDLTRHYAQRLRMSMLAQLSALLPRRMPHLTTLVKAAQLPLAGLVRYPGLVQFDVFFNHGRLLERFYRARPWPGRTLVYRAKDNPDDDGAWSELLPGSHTVHDVACEHFSILREPHVVKIANSIATEIDAVLASPSPSRRG